MQSHSSAIFYLLILHGFDPARDRIRLRAELECPRHDPCRSGRLCFSLTQLFYTGNATMPYHKSYLSTWPVRMWWLWNKIWRLLWMFMWSAIERQFRIKYLPGIYVNRGGRWPNRLERFGMSQWGVDQSATLCSCSQTSCCEFLL